MNAEKAPETLITKQQYWDEFYSDELSTFTESGHAGEEWFGHDTRSIAQWITSLPNVKPSEDKVLDIGAGNGLFLIRLARVGFKRLYGCDYVPAATLLALNVCQTYLTRLQNGEIDLDDDYEEEDSRVHDSTDHVNNDAQLFNGVESVKVTLTTMDITASPEELPKQTLDKSVQLDRNKGIRNDDNNNDNSHTDNNNHADNVVIESPMDFRQFDIIHDKGTFDLFFMRGDVALYIASICQHFVQEQTLICITSCNATENELIDSFVNHRFPPTSKVPLQHRFHFECISTLPHRSIVFQGVSGQSVATVAFRATLKTSEKSELF